MIQRTEHPARRRTLRRKKRQRRRAAIRHAAVTRTSIWLSRGRLQRVRPGKDFSVTQRTVELPNLPDELCGMTITHISDPHIGQLVTPAHMWQIVGAANALGGDMIAVTGDFIDFSNEYLPPVIEALQQLEAPLGVFCVLGNHDHLDNARQLVRAFNDAGIELLMNRRRTVRHHDKRIAIAGIDWAHRDTELAQYVQQACNGHADGDLNLLLAHHPHAFDAACRRGVDLTLAGHTHGGQMLISKRRSKKGSIGLASLAFRYTRGLYARGDHRLYVSSGVGSWFPIRFRCPAEITLLELQTTF